MAGQLARWRGDCDAPVACHHAAVLRNRPRLVTDRPVLRGVGVVLRPPTHDDVPHLISLEDDVMRRRFGNPRPARASDLHLAIDRWDAAWNAGRTIANYLVCDEL